MDEIKIRRVISKKKKLCPHCLKEVRPTSNLGGWLLPQEYSCNKCGYFGSVAIEDEN